MELSWASAALSSRRGADNQAEKADWSPPGFRQAGEKPYRSSDREDMMTTSNAICLELLRYDTAHDCLPFLTHKNAFFFIFYRFPSTWPIS